MERPKVGVGVIVIKDGRYLLQKRKTPHGNGTWCCPGGHLEHGESFEECARRETKEESGVEIKNIRFATATNDIFDDGKHYVTIWMIADWESEEPKVMEPDKAEVWEWFEWDNLPEPLFLSEKNLRKQGFRPDGL